MNEITITTPQVKIKDFAGITQVVNIHTDGKTYRLAKTPGLTLALVEITDASNPLPPSSKYVDITLNVDDQSTAHATTYAIFMQGEDPLISSQNSMNHYLLCQSPAMAQQKGISISKGLFFIRAPTTGKLDDPTYTPLNLNNIPRLSDEN